jgi:hypothetical protein
MRSILEVIIALIISALFFVGLSFFLPTKGKIERTIDIERPAIHVFDAVNSTRRFSSWQPYTVKDSQADIDFSELQDGVGAKVMWSSQVPEIGKGSQEITAAEREKLVQMKLDMGGRTGTGTIKIEPKEVGVKVIFQFETEFKGLLDRYKGLYLDSEQGDHLTMGLAGLKAMLESSPYASDYSALNVEVKDVAAVPALTLKGIAKGYEGQPLNVPRDRQVAIEALQKAATAANLTAGSPQFVELSRDPINYVVEFDTFLPVDKTEGVRLPGDIKAATTLSGKYIVAKHVGSRDSWAITGQTKDQALAYANVFDYRVSDPANRKIMLEYLSPPGTIEAQFETNVYVPIDN